jgi:hypothetical protein
VLVRDQRQRVQATARPARQNDTLHGRDANRVRRELRVDRRDEHERREDTHDCDDQAHRATVSPRVVRTFAGLSELR